MYSSHESKVSPTGLNLSITAYNPLRIHYAKMSMEDNIAVYELGHIKVRRHRRFFTLRLQQLFEIHYVKLLADFLSIIRYSRVKLLFLRKCYSYDTVFKVQLLCLRKC